MEIEVNRGVFPYKHITCSLIIKRIRNGVPELLARRRHYYEKLYFRKILRSYMNAHMFTTKNIA